MKNIIFDLDGTLFKTEELSKQSFLDIASRENIKLSEDLLNSFQGTTKDEITKRLIQNGIDPAYFEHVHIYWKKLIDEKIKTKDALCKEGFFELFDYLSEYDYTIAIATSSDMEHVKKLLNHLSKKVNIKTIITGDMVSKSKPDPEIFLKAMDSLNVQACECLVVEDSNNGLLSAKRAGLRRCYIKDINIVDKTILDEVEFKIEHLNELIPILKKVDE